MNQEAQKEAAVEAYKAFCESGGMDNHPFQDAWDDYRVHRGDILSGSIEENLIVEAILYGIEVGANMSAEGK